MISRRRLHHAYAASGYSDAFFDTLTERDMRRAGMVGWVSRVTPGGGGGSDKDKRANQKRPSMFEIGMVEEEEEGEKGPSGGKGKGVVGMGASAWEGIKVSRLWSFAAPRVGSPV